MEKQMIYYFKCYSCGTVAMSNKKKVPCTCGKRMVWCSLKTYNETMEKKGQKKF